MELIFINHIEHCLTYSELFEYHLFLHKLFCLIRWHYFPDKTVYHLYMHNYYTKLLLFFCWDPSPSSSIFCPATQGRSQTTQEQNAVVMGGQKSRHILIRCLTFLFEQNPFPTEGKNLSSCLLPSMLSNHSLLTFLSKDCIGNLLKPINCISE